MGFGLSRVVPHAALAAARGLVIRHSRADDEYQDALKMKVHSGHVAHSKPPGEENYTMPVQSDIARTA